MVIKRIIAIIFLVLVSACVFLTGFTPKDHRTPKTVYQVYLEGNKIGLIKSKEELEEYIDNEQSAIKKKYKVDTVYVPNGLEIKKEITYNTRISSAKKIYEMIKDLDSFTIKGYAITIKEDEKEYQIYVLDRKIFDDAVEKTIRAFVDSEKYASYLNSNQKQITTTGSVIEKVEVNSKINVVESFVSTNRKIYTTVEEMSKFLLYGEHDESSPYIVKEGDTIDQISYNNKLSVEEFLVANPKLTSADILLLEGQNVNVGLIDPQIKVTEQVFVVTDEPKKFNTQIVYDDTLYSGVSFVRQEGIDGLNRVSQSITRENGDPVVVKTVGVEELIPSVDKVVVKGDKYVPNVGINGYWYWPTVSPYLITTYYGYRWGEMHGAIDIAGCPYNSPIYAANNGTVTFAGYRSGYGNYIVINHNNGFYTLYGHMSKLNVTAGQDVSRGQIIGGMGNSGFVVGRTGIHLHYGMYLGDPNTGAAVNPLKYY